MTLRIAALIVVGLLATGCSDGPGQTFHDFEAVKSSEAYADWVVMGRFGPDGPFEVVAETDFDLGEECTFAHDGASHKYPGMPGYRFKVLKLQGQEGSESTVVLRSKEKD